MRKPTDSTARKSSANNLENLAHSTSLDSQTQNNNTRETYIVQNVTPGHYFVSDIGLEFKPFEVVDLTWLDPQMVYYSRDLKRSLQKGHLNRITQQKADDIMKKEVDMERAKKQQELQQKKQQRNLVATEDHSKVLDVEILELKHEGPRNTEDVTTAGYVNDADTYTMAFAKAQSLAAKAGKTLDAREFSAKVNNDPSYLGKLLGIESVHVERGGAKVRGGTVAVAGDDYEGGTATAPFYGASNSDIALDLSVNPSIDVVIGEYGVAETLELGQD